MVLVWWGVYSAPPDFGWLCYLILGLLLVLIGYIIRYDEKIK